MEVRAVIPSVLPQRSAHLSRHPFQSCPGPNPAGQGDDRPTRRDSRRKGETLQPSCTGDRVMGSVEAGGGRGEGGDLNDRQLNCCTASTGYSTEIVIETVTIYSRKIRTSRSPSSVVVYSSVFVLCSYFALFCILLAPIVFANCSSLVLLCFFGFFHSFFFPNVATC